MMKRIVVLLMLAVFVLFTACASQEGGQAQSPSADTPVPQSSEPEPQSSEPAAQSTEPAASAEVLRVSMSPDFAPMEFVDTTKEGQDSFAGFDVFLAKFIAQELGRPLEIIPMSFDGCLIALEDGRADLSISGHMFSDESAEKYNLSDPYYAGEYDEDLPGNAVVLPKGADELTAKVNEAIAKAREYEYENIWWVQATDLSQNAGAKEVHYDDDGNVIG